MYDKLDASHLEIATATEVMLAVVNAKLALVGTKDHPDNCCRNRGGGGGNFDGCDWANSGRAFAAEMQEAKWASRGDEFAAEMQEAMKQALWVRVN